MPNAARVDDPHTCPVTTPAAHVGGPLLPPGEATVEITQKHGSIAGESADCKGPLDEIMLGSPFVYYKNQMAARVDDPTVHGGLISGGCATVIVGGPTAVVTESGGIVTVKWGAMTVTGSRADVVFFSQMLREEAARSPSVQSLLATITGDASNPTNIQLVRGAPGIWVDAYGGHGNQTFDLDEFSGSEFPATASSGHPNQVTRGENLVHGLDEAHQGAVHQNTNGVDPTGNNWYNQSHQHAIDAENVYRSDIGQTTTLVSSNGGPGPNQVTFLFSDGSREVHDLSTGNVVHYDASGAVIP